MVGYIKQIFGLLLSLITLIGGTFMNISICKDPDMTKPFVREDAEPLTAEPEDTAEPVRISDKLAMPRIVSPAVLKTISADLNTAEKGYATGSLMTEAFNGVFDKVVIFRAGEDVDAAYVLGEKVTIRSNVRQTETGYYIPLRLVNEVFGGALSEKGGKTVLAADAKTVTVADGKAYLHESGRSYAPEDSIEYTADGSVNVKDAARLFGLTEYHTDAGLVFFSVGDAFDPLKGYYVAEEAEKLWLDGDAAADYSANMFVDIPNVIQNGQRCATVYTDPELDINANVAAYATQGVTAKVDLGPAIVAGQGEDKSNYTVVRIFDAYQTLHTQFNAYPSSVRGGVQVAAAGTADGFPS